MKIIFTGGGTGGHIFPILAIAREARRICPPEKKLNLYYMGSKDRFGKILLSQEGIRVKTVFTGKIRRYLGWSILENLVDVFIKVPLGTLQAFFYIFFLAPDLIFSKGGYGSFPAVISGWLLRIPVFLHESDITPGLANKILSKFCLEIFASFPNTEYFPPKKIIVVGNPIRREILEGSTKEAKILFKLSGEKPVILILGGSQGAQKINDTVLNILPEILKEFELIHQCGEKNYKQVKAGAKVMITKDLEKYYHLRPFLRETEIKHAYQVSQAIISRAGSGSIFEIAALNKPSILIPLPTAAQGHQIKNAYAYARTGATIVIEEVNFTPHFFLEKVKYLFSRPEEMEKMKEGARQFARPRAAKIIAEYILDYLSSK